METRNLRVSRSARARRHAVVVLAAVLLAWSVPASAEETIRWERRQGIAESGGTISRASGASLSAASSVQFLKSGDGYARFVVGDNSSAKVLGLSTAPSNAIGSIAFGVSLDSSGVAKAVEGGTLGTTIGSFSVSDEFKIAIESGVAVVRRNGTVVHTFSATPAYPLYGHAILTDAGGSVTTAAIHGTLAELVQWTNAVNVSAQRGSLVRTALTSADDGGAISTRGLSSGDGYVEWVIAATGATRTLGLGVGDSNQTRADVNFGLYLSGSTLTVYESGTNRGGVGSYAVGDVLRVGVESGTVVYRRNGTLLYTSTVSPSYPLLVDATLNTANSSLGSIAMSGNLADVATSRVTMTPSGGVYAGSQTVTVSSATSGATIYYTLDGSEPTTSSSSVSNGGTVSVNASARLRARAYGSGLWASAEGSEFFAVGTSPATESVSWTNLTNVSVSGSTLTKVLATTSYDAGAVSVRAIQSTDGYAEFQALSIAGGRLAGLSFGDTDAGNGDVDYGFNLVGGGPLKVIESGVERGTVGTYAANDILRVAVENGVVTYRKNGTLLYTSTIAPRYPLLVDASINGNGESISNAVISGHLTDVGVQQPVFGVAAGDYGTGQAVAVTVGTPGATIYYTLNGTDPTQSDATVASGGTVSVSTSATLKARAFATGLFPSRVAAARYTIGLGSATTESATWTNVVNATTSGSSLTKNFATTGYNSGGASTKAFDSTDGYVEFQALSAAGGRLAGLSFGDTDSSNFDVDFAFLLNGGGTLKVMESGIDRGTVGTYAVNDTLRVSVENGVVKYRKNGTLMYTSAVSPAYPLLLDASINSNGEAISNAVISGHLIDVGTQQPAFSVAAGDYATGQTVTVTVGTAGAVIHYTLNGVDPTESDATVASGGTVSVGASATLKARAFTTGLYPSRVTSARYTIGLGSATTESVVWTNIVNATVSGSTVTKAFATAGYNAGAVSTRGFDSTDGYVEFQALSTATQRNGGLSVGDADAGNFDVDYAFRLVGSGALTVMESGVDRGSVGTYAVNDILRVAVENGVVKYRKNGTLLYTSSVPPGYPLLFDTSLSTNGGAISNAVISGHLIDARLPAPTPNPVAGSYDAAVNVSLSVPVAGATIRYTTNGSDPDGSSSVYSAPIALSLGAPVTVKSFATAPGYLDGTIGSATYTFTAKAPVFSPDSGAYYGPLSITANSATSGATIYYTLNGATPTTASSSVANGGSISVPTNATLKAIAAGAGLADSSVTSATYEVVTTVPVITPAGGTYVSSVEVTISAVPGATVLYTTNGAEPTGGSAVYTAPFTLTTNTTVKAKAFATIGSSATVSADFVVKVADPVLSPASGKWYTQQPVSVSTSTTGATIYYTTDGSEPTTSSPAVSGGVVTVDRSMTLRVKAFKTGMTSSAARGRYAVTGDIRSGTSFMVALKADKTVWVWGRNESGQLGRGDVTPSSPQLSPLQVSGLTDIEAIAVGTSHVIALRTNGTLKAWGLNSNGQLGIGSTTNQSSPTDISTLSNVVEIAAGDNFSMARLANGQIWTWGGNGSYQLALGGTSTTNQTSPVQSGFTDDSAPVQMAAGQGFSLVLFADGTVKSAGLNASGSLGNNGTVNASTPQNVLLPAGITRIFAGRSETAFAVAGDTTSTLQLFGWGSNSVGALGLGTTGVNHKTPVLIDTGRSHVAVGDSHSIFGGPIGLLAGAGTSSNGELGVGVSPAPLLPRMAPIPGGLQSVALVGGTVTSAAIGVDGSVWTWGKGTDGALGHGNTTFAYTPKKIAGFALVVNPEVAVDTDGDGLSDSLEYVNGTDPMLADTNGDGVDDGAALLLGEKALTLDADGDGLTAGQEAIIGTDPNKADTDGDTVSDSVDAFPLDATRSTNPADANDHTPPVITLTKPVTAIPIS